MTRNSHGDEYISDATQAMGHTTESEFLYYVQDAGNGRFNLRQTRYIGKNAHHDLMAQGFTADQMRDIINKWFQSTDTRGLV